MWLEGSRCAMSSEVRSPVLGVHYSEENRLKETQMIYLEGNDSGLFGQCM